MPRPYSIPRQYSIADARNSLPALIHSVENGAPVELTRRGRPVAVLLSRSEYQKLKRGKSDLWEAIQEFRQSTDLEDLDVDAVYAGVRDPSPGREPEL